MIRNTKIIIYSILLMSILGCTEQYEYTDKKNLNNILNSFLSSKTLILDEKSLSIIFSESDIISIIGSINLPENLSPNQIDKRIIKKFIARNSSLNCF